jgi:predicted GNAT family N-acyltransferase
VTVTVRRARDEREVADAIALRAAVFVDEQGVPLEEDLDGRDGEALHLVAVEDAGGDVIGTCRLLTDGPTLKLGRMAVAARARRRGIGMRLLAVADDEAERASAERIVLAAQLSALQLYEQAGYEARGDVFLDAGIEHVWMEKRHA